MCVFVSGLTAAAYVGLAAVHVGDPASLSLYLLLAVLAFWHARPVNLPKPPPENNEVG